ncbi:hypothetical protein MZM54_03615 [[Brevibacterium] frigoritolerans]|nr:hypothetical protein [Peribacillus frigoritolerans]
MSKYVPQHYWRTMRRIEADVEHFEEKEKAGELSDDHKKVLESARSELAKFQKRIEESTWCSKCSRVKDNGKQEHPDLCCTCDTK